MKNFLDKIPFSILILVTLLMGLAPFMQEPHLWQKIKMLSSGELTRPLDIFDLLMHGTPLALLIVKVFFKLNQNTTKKS